MIGDANTLSTIVVDGNYATPSGHGSSAFDVNPYIPGYGGAGLTWSSNTNTFYRQIRNFNFDLTNAPNNTAAIHWQIAQVTSIQNVNIKLRPKTAPGNIQVGILTDNGSGEFFSDITVTGGFRAFSIGSQQFTSRNLKVDGATESLHFTFFWLWTISQITVTNCMGASVWAMAVSQES
jgi:glucan 1,3-beta-glucosidase